MRRRRLIVVAAVAALVVGAAWWVSLDRLSDEEQKLVGTWRYYSSEGDDQRRVELAPDRRALFWDPFSDTPRVSHWSARGGIFVLDHETSPLRRAVRPVAVRLGVRVGAADTWQITWLTADIFTKAITPDSRITFIRVPPR
jgi:hypothetical protein